HSARGALAAQYARVPSLEAFGRRPRRLPHPRHGPASETLHRRRHSPSLLLGQRHNGHHAEALGMSDQPVPDLPAENAHEGQGVEQLAQEIPTYGSVEADALLARPARAWRDRAGRERTDHLRPPGYIWVGTGWLHRKLTFEGLRNWESYSTANPGIWRTREKLLTPPQAWPPGRRRQGSKR